MSGNTLGTTVDPMHFVLPVAICVNWFGSNDKSDKIKCLWRRFDGVHSVTCDGHKFVRSYDTLCARKGALVFKGTVLLMTARKCKVVDRTMESRPFETQHGI